MPTPIVSSVSGNRGTRILCAQNELGLRAGLTNELVAAGYEVTMASDGCEALVSIEETRPDLVLCDVGLPRLSGHEVLRSVRVRRPDMADVPFILLGARGAREDMIEGKRAGVDDYLVKPVDFELMLTSIETCLRRVRGNSPFSRAPAQDGAVRCGHA